MATPSMTRGVPPTLAWQGDPSVTVGATQAPQRSAGIAKLQKAAQDFEAIMIDSLWGSMKDGSLGSDDDLNDSSSRSLEQLGMQMVSGALAKAGGLGIGKMIVHSLQSKV
jgi:Rod binding domain-containing protein